MKKSIIILSIIFIVLSVLSTQAYALNATMSCSADKLKVKPGEYVNITVGTSNLEGSWIGFEASLDYDTEVFEEASIDWKITADQTSFTNNKITIAKTTPVTENTTLFILKLKVKSDTSKESGTVTLSAPRISNFTDGTINLTSYSTEIIVEDELEPVTPEDPTVEPTNPTKPTQEVKEKPEELPNAGIEIIVIVGMATIIIAGVIALIKYKNILK